MKTTKNPKIGDHILAMGKLGVIQKVEGTILTVKWDVGYISKVKVDYLRRK